MFNKIKKIPGAIVRRVKIYQEKKKGLDFTKSHSEEDLDIPREIGKLYAPTLKHDMHQTLDYLKIQPTDAILDCGVGKGAALAMMSEYNFRLLGGVDLSPKMIEICKKNLATLGIKNVNLYVADAGKFNQLEEYTHFYLFNPFPGITLKGLLDNIALSCKKNPRKITFIYYCPRHRDVIDQHPFFHLEDELEGKYWKTLLYSNTK